MINKSRKRLWPVSLVMAVAIVGVAAAFLVLASSPTASIEAHSGAAGSTHCDDLDQFGQLLHDALNDHTCAEGQTNRAPAASGTIPNPADIAPGGTASVDVTDAFTDADGDTLTYANMSSDTDVVTVNATGSPVVVTGVGAGTATITVTASDGTASATQTFTVTVKELPTAPPAAPGASLLDIDLVYGTGTVTVSWEAVEGAAEYLVQYRQCTSYPCAGVLTSAQPITDGSTSYTITGLNTKEVHQIVVTASDADGKVLSQSDPDMVCPAAPPTKLKVEPLDNAVRLSWKDPVDPFHNIVVTGFEIERVTYLQDSSNPILKTNPVEYIPLGKVNQRWDLGLSYGVTYTYRVRAEVEITDSAGNRMMGYSLWSDPQTAIVADSGGRLTPLEEPPSAVRGLVATPACADDITISWEAPEDFGVVSARRDVNGVYVGPDFIGGEGAGKVEQGKKATSVTYQVQRSVNNGPWELEATLNVTIHSDDDVAYPAAADDPPNVYKYRVRAMNEAGHRGPWREVSEELTEPPAPLRPTSLVVNLEEDQQAFELQWDPPADTAKPKLWRTVDDINDDHQSDSLAYIIQWQVGESSDWETIVRQPHQYSRSGLNTVLTQEFIHNAETDSDFSLSAIRDKVVRYRVAAEVDQCNASAWNQADEVEVPAATEPGMPTGLTATADGQDKIALSWTAPADNGGSAITGYSVQYRIGDGDWFVPMSVGNVTSYSHTGLQAGTTYEYRVAAMNEVGSGMASATDEATTESAAPPPPVFPPAITGASSDAAGSATIMLTPGANADWQIVWAEPSDGSMGMYSDWVAGNATSVTMTGLASGMSYWFTAIAYGNGEFSAYSGWSALTPVQ